MTAELDALGRLAGNVRKTVKPHKLKLKKSKQNKQVSSKKQSSKRDESPSATSDDKAQVSGNNLLLM